MTSSSAKFWISHSFTFLIASHTLICSAETVVTIPEAPIEIIDGARLDINGDGIFDFEINTLTHQANAIEIHSMRLLGLTRIEYPEVNENPPILYHNQFIGLLKSFDRFPGADPTQLIFESNSFVFGEFLRIENLNTGETILKSNFDASDRTYLALTMEQEEGLIYGWAEVRLLDGIPSFTATGYETQTSKASIMGGISAINSLPHIENSNGNLELTWQGQTGIDYQIEGSNNLRDWLPISAISSIEATHRLPIPETGQQYFRLITARSAN